MDISTIFLSGVLAIIVQVVGSFWLKERLKQSIKHEYDKNLEQIKRDLEFELDKKKKLYEGKLAQYKKYFSMIDSYSENSRKELFKGFESGLLNILNDPSNENVQKYFQNIFALQRNISDHFLTFKTEINGLRLEAGQDLLSLLDQYVEKLEIVFNKTAAFMSEMNSTLTQFSSNPGSIQARSNEFMTTEVQNEGKELMELQKAIFKEMRRELGII